MSQFERRYKIVKVLTSVTCSYALSEDGFLFVSDIPEKDTEGVMRKILKYENSNIDIDKFNIIDNVHFSKSKIIDMDMRSDICVLLTDKKEVFMIRSPYDIRMFYKNKTRIMKLDIEDSNSEYRNSISLKFGILKFTYKIEHEFRSDVTNEVLYKDFVMYHSICTTELGKMIRAIDLMWTYSGFKPIRIFARVTDSHLYNSKIPKNIYFGDMGTYIETGDSELLYTSNKIIHTYPDDYHVIPKINMMVSMVDVESMLFQVSNDGQVYVMYNYYINKESKAPMSAPQKISKHFFLDNNIVKIFTSCKQFITYKHSQKNVIIFLDEFGSLYLWVQKNEPIKDMSRISEFFDRIHIDKKTFDNDKVVHIDASIEKNGIYRVVFCSESGKLYSWSNIKHPTENIIPQGQQNEKKLYKFNEIDNSTFGVPNVMIKETNEINTIDYTNSKENSKTNNESKSNDLITMFLPKRQRKTEEDFSRDVNKRRKTNENEMILTNDIQNIKENNDENLYEKEDMKKATENMEKYIENLTRKLKDIKEKYGV